jgi:hypothetical protein
MGGSVQVENDNIDENANDQSKHQLDPRLVLKTLKDQNQNVKMVVILP